MFVVSTVAIAMIGIVVVSVSVAVVPVQHLVRVTRQMLSKITQGREENREKVKKYLHKVGKLDKELDENRSQQNKKEITIQNLY